MTDDQPVPAATPEQTHSAEWNRGYAEGNAAALDACNPIIEKLQAALRAPTAPAGLREALHRRIELAMTVADGPLDRRELVHAAIDELVPAAIASPSEEPGGTNGG
jgi:hypothetical protein